MRESIVSWQSRSENSVSMSKASRLTRRSSSLVGIPCGPMAWLVEWWNAIS